ncbi:MAG: P27 family phage terminase small subunit [Terriglobales bacterium]
MAGRRPNPKKVHKARGNAGKRPAAATPEAPKGTIAPLPEVLTDKYAEQEWQHIIGDLTRMGIARPLYATVLSLYCVVVGKIRHALEELAGEQIVYAGKNGPRLNPKFDLIYKLLTRLLPLATECGITPASTRRLHAPEPPPPDEVAAEREFFAEE